VRDRGQSAWADEAAAKKWIDSEFQPSTLSKTSSWPR
jgi:glycerol transport system substrate-binding protein